MKFNKVRKLKFHLNFVILQQKSFLEMLRNRWSWRDASRQRSKETWRMTTSIKPLSPLTTINWSHLTLQRQLGKPIDIDIFSFLLLHYFLDFLGQVQLYGIVNTVYDGLLSLLSGTAGISMHVVIDTINVYYASLLNRQFWKKKGNLFRLFEVRMGLPKPCDLDL